ncbi:unnamed protein product [Rodentolepis nana]|uniref:Uncharacterized protein n=1 Tax=Rodentolepis nana TaxID=102285 RepID=A0A3P7S7L9_RODNA|nr:unnamed protein product [Rodentolepis nana]
MLPNNTADPIVQAIIESTSTSQILAYELSLYALRLANLGSAQEGTLPSLFSAKDAHPMHLVPSARITSFYKKLYHTYVITKSGKVPTKMSRIYIEYDYQTRVIFLADFNLIGSELADEWATVMTTSPIESNDDCFNAEFLEKLEQHEVGHFDDVYHKFMPDEITGFIALIDIKWRSIAKQKIASMNGLRLEKEKCRVISKTSTVSLICAR